MFRTSIAVTLLAIMTCSNAQGQTTASTKAGAIQNWWRGQTSQYAQRNRSLFQRGATASRGQQPTNQQATKRKVHRGNIQQVAAQSSAEVYPLPAPNAPKEWAPKAPPSVRVQERLVHVPGRGTVKVSPRPAASTQPARRQAVPVKTARLRSSQRPPVRTAQAPLRPVPTRPVAMRMHQPAAPMSYGGGASYGGGSGMNFGHYPVTGASLYPSPQPNVPYQVGGTAITNQAFYPHEMLYAHKYKALYPPYYHRVKGHWALTPFGVWSQEQWKVEGTEVEVEYRSHISPFSGFKPPFIR